MTTWSNITDAEIAVDKAIKASTHRKMRDNITALADGATGAPRVSALAVNRTLPVTATLSSNVLIGVFSPNFDGLVIRDGFISVPDGSPIDLRRYSGQLRFHRTIDYTVWVDNVVVFNGGGSSVIDFNENSKIEVTSNNTTPLSIYADARVVEIPPICYEGDLIE